MMRQHGLHKVGDLIDLVLSQVAHVEVGPVMRIRGVWPEVAGRWAGAASPVRLKDGVLTVEVDSGATASKLRYGTREVLDNIQRAVGESVEITSISIRVAKRR